MKKGKISVIIPIYQVEQYLVQCLDSVLCQDHPDFEVIAVNDGSTDGCREICDYYAGKDSKVRVFHTDNQGVYKALAFGVLHAAGEYISFVDGDDYLSGPKVLSCLFEKAVERGADITIGNYDRDYKGTLVQAKRHTFSADTDTGTIDFRFKGFYSIGHLAYYWGKLYKRSFLKQDYLAKGDFQYAKDKLFNIKCYLDRPKYCFVSDPVYVYRYNTSSDSHSYKKDFGDIWIGMSKEIYTDMKHSGKDDAMDLVAHQLLFGVFFSSKQEYVTGERNWKVFVKELKYYNENELVRMFRNSVLKGKYLNFRKGYLWKLFLWGMSLGLFFHAYFLLAMGMKLLIDWNIDTRLSSVGMKIKEEQRRAAERRSE